MQIHTARKRGATAMEKRSILLCSKLERGNVALKAKAPAKRRGVSLGVGSGAVR